MDKRLINFMLISMLLIIGYAQINLFLNPPPPPPPVELEVETADPDLADPLAVEVQAAGDEGAGDEAVAAESLPGELAEIADDAVAERPPAPLSRFTVGSVDPADGFPLLVTFISAGAAVERVELSDPRYQDEDKSAYIGHLALESVADGTGLRVNVVGRGTPAAKAGLQVGDVITEIAGRQVVSPSEFDATLASLNAGDVVAVTVKRPGQADGGGASVVTLTSTRMPMQVIRPPADDGSGRQLSYLLTLQQIGPRRTEFDQIEFPQLPSLRDENWHAEVFEQAGGATQVEFRFVLGRADLAKLNVSAAVEVVKRFTLRPLQDEATQEVPALPDYHLDFEVELVNQGNAPLELAFRLDGPTGLPLEGWWYTYKTHPTKFGGAGVRDVVWRARGKSHNMFTNPTILKAAKTAEKEKTETGSAQGNPFTVIADSAEGPGPLELQYAGVDAQYFSSALLAPTTLPDEPGCGLQRVVAFPVGPIDPLRENRTDVTFRVESTVRQVQPGAANSDRQKFLIFAGPKKPSVLAAYGLDDFIVYGWFKWPAQLMGVLLHFFYGIVRNYGVAIVLLTVVVRASMFPIGRKQALNAQKMQELTPEIKKIKEKYPDDVQKQTAAQQELFRKHKYNPLSGCLPIFLQLPIFIGLYRALSVDVELRQTPLIPGLEWCSNLAAPDMLWRWDAVIPINALTGFTGWLGPYLNVLPLVSSGLFLVHQKMFTPPPTDEQQEMQQRIMKFMMLFMVVLFFKVPAGLCIYFITSSLWALGERKMLPNKTPAGPEQTPISLAGGKKPGGDGNGASAAALKKSRRKRSKR